MPSPDGFKGVFKGTELLETVRSRTDFGFQEL
jgi:hypothetical protein